MLTFCCGTVDVVRCEIMKIYGIQLDQAGRCRHYHSEADVVALRCCQCHKYYACYKCHDESENHDFKHIWMDHHPRPANLEELETLVQGAIDYFNRKRAYASKNGLTAEQFRNQAGSC